MTVYDRPLRDEDLIEILNLCRDADWSLEKAYALYELANRALQDYSLLPTAWTCISSEIEYQNRQGPPLGQPAAALLMESAADWVIQSLADSISKWTQRQQEDFFFGIIPKGSRRNLAQLLRNRYQVILSCNVDKLAD